MDKRNLIDSAVLILLIIAIIGLVENYKQTKEDTYVCLRNPFIYGSQLYSQGNGAEVWGNLYIQGYREPAIQFNRTGMIKLPLTQHYDFNFQVNESALQG